MPKSVFTDAYASLLETVVETRKARGVSQVELARRLGKTQPFVSYFERGERRIGRAAGVHPGIGTSGGCGGDRRNLSGGARQSSRGEVGWRECAAPGPAQADAGDAPGDPRGGEGLGARQAKKGPHCWGPICRDSLLWRAFEVPWIQAPNSQRVTAAIVTQGCYRRIGAVAKSSE